MKTDLTTDHEKKAALFQEQPSIQSKIPWIIQPIYRLNQAR